MADRVPLIGITSSLERAQQGAWDQRYGMVPETYLSAVSAGGGTALLLPPQPFDDHSIERVLGALDGLVLTGGVDVDPDLYGAPRHIETQSSRPERDAWEIALVLAAFERDLPVLAICRGVQVLNVALGGTLHQHLPALGVHDHGAVPGLYVPTEVATVPGTRVGRLVGPTLRAHCHHHQALDRVADQLTVAATSPDGVVEAVEVVGAAFTLGVQWHPEQDAADRRLFAALVDASRADRTRARTTS